MKILRVYLYDCLYNEFSSLFHANLILQPSLQRVSLRVPQYIYKQDSFYFCPSPSLRRKLLLYSVNTHFDLVIPISRPLSKLSSFCLGKSIPGYIWGQALVTPR